MKGFLAICILLSVVFFSSNSWVNVLCDKGKAQLVENVNYDKSADESDTNNCKDELPVTGVEDFIVANGLSLSVFFHYNISSLPVSPSLGYNELVYQVHLDPPEPQISAAAETLKG